MQLHKCGHLGQQETIIHGGPHFVIFRNDFSILYKLKLSFALHLQPHFVMLLKKRENYTTSYLKRFTLHQIEKKIKDRKMALIQLATMDDSVAALIVKKRQICFKVLGEYDTIDKSVYDTHTKRAWGHSNNSKKNDSTAETIFVVNLNREENLLSNKSTSLVKIKNPSHF
uniref:(California timema) hypothetical protein n=1 Tax=Timema californicum TaxID=61474 RepID=A0A7R9IVW1_TIMCA|nr:unnamed protein product [Timema californicum]